MESYRDMTFCSFWKECKDGEACWRALTDKIVKEAEEAEKEGLPVCQFVYKPDCFVEKN